MRTHAVVARVSARGACLLLCLLAGGLLLGRPALAQAQGRVTFNQMSVEACPESSGCEWKLSCGVNGQAQAEMLVADGRTKDLKPINKSVEVKSFPATVECTVWEDDGMFTASWEDAGKGSLTVPVGGEYRFDIDHPEQGSVRILLSVDSLEVAIPAAAAPAAGKKAPAKPASALQFGAVFNPSKEGHAVIMGLEYKPFKERVDKLAAQGIKLVDIEIIEAGGKQLWSGIFRNVPDRVVLRANQEWKEFSDQWKQMTGGLARLVDLEIYGTKPLYAGIYRDYSDRNRPMLWVDERKPFAAKVADLAVGGQPLIDVEIFTGGPKVTYAGTFRTTSGQYELWTNLDRAAFEAKYKQPAAKGWEMIDLETYTEGKKRVFDAIVRSGVGTPGELALGLDQAGFVRKWLDATGKGQRLVSVEAYRD